LGRKINRKATIHPITVTLLSMGIGSIIMLASGLALQGLPVLSTKSILIILLLAVVNTAFTFTLWNYALQTLSAIESSIINGTMMVQIAILAWIFLGEKQELQQIIALFLAFVGAVIVNLRFQAKQKITPPEL
jgi:drug/metabolite transporter (DMT)-like permease